MDVQVKGKIETDLYVKQTDKHQYLYCMSCHPRKCKESIPYARDMRLSRICSTTQAVENRARNLSNFLVVRGYDRVFVQQQIQKVRLVTMEGALNPHLQKGKKGQCTNGILPSKPTKYWGYTSRTSVSHSLLCKMLGN